jgi:serine/threonine-protein kinase
MPVSEPGAGGDGRPGTAVSRTPDASTSGETRAASEIELILRAALADRYVVERLIGRGGMATVYLARDLRHERRVALKVLDRELGAVLGVERFLAEIRVTANLQHPNILPLFDSGEANGLLFYVTPYIDGESLRARLTRERQLPVDEAVRLAVGVASALQYAHRQGVIHRDLKPDNILLQEGQPLLADFGIALAVSNAGGSRVTQTGLSLGTPQYMSPEQATADQHVDGRSDIYSLAAVLYEMLTGDPPHVGSTAQAIIARVVTERPRPVRVSRPSVPTWVAAAVERALEKIPADRFASALDFAEALQGRGAVSGATDAEAPRPEPPAPSRLRDPFVVALGALALVATLGAGVLWRERSEVPSSTPVRFTLDFAAGEGPVEGFGAAYALSPSGRQVVYSGRAGNQTMLYVRPMNQLSATPIAGTEGASNAAFSPDGRWLAFTTRNELRKVPMAGGSVSTVAGNLRMVTGLTWVGSDRLVFASDGALLSVPASGGTPTEVLPAVPGAGVARGAPLSLGGGLVAFAEWKRDSVSAAQLHVADLDARSAAPLGVAGISPLGMLGDELVYGTSSGTLMSVPLERGRRAATGEAAPVLEGVRTGGMGGVRAVLSPSGSLLYVRGSRDRELVDIAADGSITPIAVRAGSYSHPRLSPDGRRVAIVVGAQGGEELRVIDLGSGASTILATAPRFSPATWTRDGSALLYGMGGRDSVAVWRRPVDASAPAQRLVPLRGLFGPAAISPDGAWVLFSRPPRAEGEPGGLWYRSLTGDTATQLLVANRGAPISARFSADGRRIAYASDESGQVQVYVRDFPGSGASIQLSTEGGTQPVWSADGTRVLYRNGEAVVEATLTADGAGLASTRTVAAAVSGTNVSLMDVDASPSARRVVALRESGDGPSVVIVHDWAGELRQRLRVQRTN